MNLKLVLPVLALLLLTMPIVHAYPYSDINISASLSQTGNVVVSNVSYRITFFNLTGQASIPLFGTVSSLHIYNSSGAEMVFAKTVSPEFTFVNISGVSQGKTYLLTFFSSERVSSNDSLYQYSYSFVPPTFVRSLSIMLTLPFGAYLPSQNASFLSPPIYTISSNGKSILLVWRLENQTYFDHGNFVLPFSASYMFYSQPTSQPQGQYFLIGAIVLVVAAAIVLIVFIMSRKSMAAKIKRRNTRTQIISILTPDERKILDMIRRRESIYQHELLELTGFSKAKISKIVSKLVNYRLVKKKQMGKINELKFNRP
ncbi:MAG: hypothetical protein RAK22_00375 [Nanoarchaeota archaeon]|nr:hypothetical protein [Nanoarchaeota archaeon]